VPEAMISEDHFEPEVSAKPIIIVQGRSSTPPPALTRETGFQVTIAEPKRDMEPPTLQPVSPQRGANINVATIAPKPVCYKVSNS